MSADRIQGSSTRDVGRSGIQAPVALSFDREMLDALVVDGWLRSQRHPSADLWIYNYTEKTQYERHWTPETLACRGLILDGEGAVVARPFGKFFNYRTALATIPAEPFVVTEKVDGSLGILYYLDDKPTIATRGSFISEQALEGSRMIREREIERVPGVTPLFEIIYPGNRIVVDYGDRRDLVLLAAIRHEDGLDARLPVYSGSVVDRHGQIGDLEDLAGREEANKEGFVVAFQSGYRVKVKFAEYVRLHKIVTGVNARMIWDSLRSGDDLAALLDDVPDEIHAWIAGTRDELLKAFGEVEMAAREVFDGKPEDADRKTVAQYFIGSEASPAVLFRMLDGKPYDDLVWKAIKPGPPDRTTLWTSSTPPQRVCTLASRHWRSA